MTEYTMTCQECENQALTWDGVNSLRFCEPYKHFVFNLHQAQATIQPTDEGYIVYRGCPHFSPHDDVLGEVLK